MDSGPEQEHIPIPSSREDLTAEETDSPGTATQGTDMSSPPPLLPSIVVNSADMITPDGLDVDRPKTADSASTDVTAASLQTDWDQVLRSLKSPLPVQGSPQNSLSEAGTEDIDPFTLDLLSLDLLDLDSLASPIRSPFSRAASGMVSRARSYHGSPTLQPAVVPGHAISKSCPASPQLRPSTPKSGKKVSCPRNPFKHTLSPAANEWRRRKQSDEETSEVLDELMKYQGLEEVKQQVLDIKSKVDVCKAQDPDGNLGWIKKERFNIVFQGNPGTGKTTIARLYARFLHELKVIPSAKLEVTSGIKATTLGAYGMNELIKKMLRNGGGVLFVDEAYQLTAPYVDGVGRQVLDIILTEMEENIGRLVVIFVGYKDEMESFFEHNPGLESRIPYTMTFSDFSDGELWRILVDNINRQYSGRMRVDKGLDGLYMRIAIRRLAQARGSRGFGNARAVENLLTRIRDRQAYRLSQKKRYSLSPDHFFFTQEDLIGPDPSVAAKKCAAWAKLQEYIGLEYVKQCVERLIGMIKVNYQRELREQNPLRFSLNQLFVGAPGTGKTTVSKLYGRILADLGYLSRGDVVLKNPADFIGECLGKSEAKTKKILDATVGKILVIDEAYMLDAGDPHKEQDKFKTGVIDTIVSMVQGVPGENRSIILVGYEDKIRDMFYNVNPGLSRRFPIEQPFRFENFTLDQMEQILHMKLREEDLKATPEAIGVARDMFERALMRPNPTNAGEVDTVLATAKWNYQTRQSLIPVEQQTRSPMLEGVDFDPAFSRGTQPHADCRKMLEGRVHMSVINKLVGYQNRCLEARRHDLNPRDQVPTNFVFKGFSGTGKTTTAQQMGKIFYGMGFLSSDSVVECSAADLLGEYVGQTVPKTKKKLRDGLGRVLFIDEANQLASEKKGTFATEAVEELILFLSQPANAGKIVVILAGLTADMNHLMTRYPSLLGLFPDEIDFHHIPPDECVTLLARYLEESGFSSEDEFFTTPSSDNYISVKRLFHVLSVVPGWSNARDIKNLSKEIIGQFLERSTEIRSQDKRLSASLVTTCMFKMVNERRRLLMDQQNGAILPERPQLGADNSGQTMENPQLAPLLPPSSPAICVPGAGANHCDVDIDRAVGIQGQSHAKHQALAPTTPTHKHVEATDVDTGGNESDEDDEPDDMQSREDNVPDSVWREICQAMAAQALQRRELKAKIENLNGQLDMLAPGATGGTSGRDTVLDELTNIKTKIKVQEKVFEALEQMGRCVNGFCWYQVAGGYRCSGGAHYVSDGELSARMT